MKIVQNITKKLDGAKKEAVNDYIPRIPPSWLKYDRKVEIFCWNKRLTILGFEIQRLFPIARR